MNEQSTNNGLTLFHRCFTWIVSIKEKLGKSSFFKMGNKNGNKSFCPAKKGIKKGRHFWKHICSLFKSDKQDLLCPQF